MNHTNTSPLQQLQFYRFHSITQNKKQQTLAGLLLSVFLWCKVKDNSFLSITLPDRSSFLFAPIRRGSLALFFGGEHCDK